MLSKQSISTTLEELSKISLCLMDIEQSNMLEKLKRSLSDPQLETGDQLAIYIANAISDGVISINDPFFRNQHPLIQKAICSRIRQERYTRLSYTTHQSRLTLLNDICRNMLNKHHFSISDYEITLQFQHKQCWGNWQAVHGPTGTSFSHHCSHTDFYSAACFIASVIGGQFVIFTQEDIDSGDIDAVLTLSEICKEYYIPSPF